MVITQITANQEGDLTTQAKSRDRQLSEGLVKALANPCRLEALRIFYYRTASPNEVARELKVSLSTISHHVKILRRAGCIELVKTQQVRGATEHFYRALAPAQFADDEWGELPLTEREDISEMVLRAIFGEVLRACLRGTFDFRKDRHLSWIPIEVDEKGWQELVKQQEETLQEMMRIRAESAERLLASDEDGRRVVAAALGFETPPGFGFLDPDGSASE
jgi:DNA-binding transcriptional ArsR family regulator